MRKIIIITLLLCSLILVANESTVKMIDQLMNCTENIMIYELERLKNISISIDMVEDNWPEIKSALSENSKSRINSLSWFALPDGHYYTVDKNKVSANLSSREYFSEVLKGNPVMGYPVIGKTSGKKSLVVAYPVFREKQVVAILGTSFFVNDIRKFLLKYVNNKSQEVFYILNEEAMTILDSSDPLLSFDKPLEQKNESLKNAIKTIMKKDKGSVEYSWDQTEKIAYFKKSKLTQWHYVVSKPK